MKILLVYPEMYDSFYAFKHFSSLVGKKAAFPPLGLLTVAAMLPKHWERKLVDLNVKPLTDQDIEWADMVFLSAMNVQEPSVRQIIAQCKRKNATIVAGGPLFTHEYDRFDGIQHFILNEAEITLPLFIADLHAGQAKAIYKTEEFADVSLTPLPQMDLVNMRDYMFAIVQFSRGCPYLCDFCDVTTLFGRKPRTKSPEQMIAELEQMTKSGEVQTVLFADDNLIGNKKILKSDLLPALIDWHKRTNPGLYFMTQLTINLADDDEMMRLMLEAKFRNIFIGIETPQEDSLKFSLKNQNLKRDLMTNINKLHEEGFTVLGGFIVGFDTDKEESFKNLIDFIQESAIPIPIVNVLKAPPGTALFDRMKREQRLSKHFSFSEGDSNIIPVMGEERVRSGFLEVISNVYPAEHSYKRIKRFLEIHQFPKNGGVKVKEKYTLYQLYHFVKAVIKLAIFDKDAKHYRELLSWTYKNKRNHLSLAIGYGMWIYQLRENHNQIVNKLTKNKEANYATETEYLELVG